MDSLPLKKIPKIYHNAVIRFNEKLNSIFDIDILILNILNLKFKIVTDHSIAIEEKKKIISIVYFNIIKEYNSFLVLSQYNEVVFNINIKKSPYISIVDITGTNESIYPYNEYNIVITADIIINNEVINKLESAINVQTATQDYTKNIFSFYDMDHDKNHDLLFELVLSKLLNPSHRDEILFQVYNNLNIDPIDYSIKLEDYHDYMCNDFVHYLKMLNTFNYVINTKNSDDVKMSFEWFSDTFNVVILSLSKDTVIPTASSNIKNNIIFINKIFTILLSNKLINLYENNYLRIKAVREYLLHNYKDIYSVFEDSKLFIDIQNKPDASFFQTSEALAQLLKDSKKLDAVATELSKNNTVPLSEVNFNNVPDQDLDALAIALKNAIKLDNDDINALIKSDEDDEDEVGILTEEELAYANHPFINTDSIPVPGNSVNSVNSISRKTLNDHLDNIMLNMYKKEDKDSLKESVNLVKTSLTNMLSDITENFNESMENFNENTENINLDTSSVATQHGLNDPKIVLENDTNKLNNTLLEMFIAVDDPKIVLENDANKLNNTLLEMFIAVKNDGTIIDNTDEKKIIDKYFSKNENDIRINTIEEAIESNPKCISQHKIYSKQVVNSDEYVSKSLVNNLIKELSTIIEKLKSI